MGASTFTFELGGDAQERALAVMREGIYRPRQVPCSLYSIEGDGFNATLYAKEKHGKRKLCVQGSRAGDFVLFRLEPEVLLQASMGYEEVLDPGLSAPHCGSDESGKGDYFGPLAVCCAYVDGELLPQMRELGVKDCKKMSDASVLATGERLRALLGPGGYSVVKLSPPAYNRLYAKMRNINRMLAWAHGTAIENLLEKRPSCPRAVVDQFAPTEATILRALKTRGRSIKIEQRHKAESDMAVAAASVIAREAFLRDIGKMGEEASGTAVAGVPARKIPVGSSSPAVAALAEDMVRRHGPKWLMNNAKAHFRTTDKVLAACGLDRSALPPEGRIESAALREGQEKNQSKGE